MAWAIATAVLIYLALVALLWFFESRLVYFPGNQRTLIAPPDWLSLPVERVEISTDDSVKLVKLGDTGTKRLGGTLAAHLSWECR